jgi:hypothetical protein
MNYDGTNNLDITDYNRPLICDDTFESALKYKKAILEQVEDKTIKRYIIDTYGLLRVEHFKENEELKAFINYVANSIYDLSPYSKQAKVLSYAKENWEQLQQIYKDEVFKLINRKKDDPDKKLLKNMKLLIQVEKDTATRRKMQQSLRLMEIYYYEDYFIFLQRYHDVV